MSDLDLARLTRAIASTLCRDGYIDLEGRHGCRFLTDGTDDQIPFLAEAILAEYERDKPRAHPHEDEE